MLPIQVTLRFYSLPAYVLVSFQEVHSTAAPLHPAAMHRKAFLNICSSEVLQRASTHLTSFAVLVDVAGGLRVCLYIIMLILEMCIGTLLLIDSS